MKPQHSDFEAISWRDRPLPDLSREELLEALYYAYRSIGMLRAERDFLQDQLVRERTTKESKWKPKTQPSSL
jgi:hypothetical protein